MKSGPKWGNEEEHKQFTRYAHRAQFSYFMYSNLANIQLLEGYFVPNRQQLSPKSYYAGVFLSHLVK